MATVKVSPTGFASKAVFEVVIDLSQPASHLYSQAESVVGGSGKLIFRGKLLDQGVSLSAQGVKQGAVVIMMKGTVESKAKQQEKTPADRLVEMGYDRGRAEAAVRAVGTDLPTTIEWLSNSQPPSSPPEPKFHPVPVQEPLPPTTTDPPPRRPIQPAAEAFTSLTFLEAKSSHVYAWGNSNAGQLGTGSTTRELVPVNIAALAGVTVTQVACGNIHSLALTEAGRVYQWGRYYYPLREEEGRREAQKWGDRKTPSLVDTLAHLEIRTVAAGGVHALALDSAGNVWSWGGGLEGQLGHGSKQNELYPLLIDGLKHMTITAIAAGNEHSIAVSSEGNVFAWGNNRAGQLGVGDFEERLKPRYVFAGISESDPLLASTNPDPVARVTCGAWHTVVETTSPQALYVWGNKSFEHARLSDFSATHMRPRLIACSSSETFVLTQHGELYCVAESREVLRVEDFNEKKVKGIFSGATFSICLAEDGSAYGKGENKQGQLGMGDVQARGNDGIGTLHVNSTLLQARLSCAEAGLEPTYPGYQVGLSTAALRPFLYFLYTGNLPTVEESIQLELRTYGESHRLERLRDLCRRGAVKPKSNAGDSGLKGLALKEAVERARKRSESASSAAPAASVPWGEAMEVDEEEEKRANIEEALQRMREYKQAMEEKRLKVLQSLESRATEGEAMEVVEPVTVIPEPPPTHADDHDEADRTQRRAKILSALEKRNQ